MIIKNKILVNKYWGSIIPVILCLLLSPPFQIKENFSLINTASDWHYYDVIIEQMNGIGNIPLPEDTHESKMEVRILMPLLLKIIYPFDHIHLPKFIYFLNIFALYLFSLQLSIFQNRHLPNLKPVFLTSLIFTTIYTGISFVKDFFPMFDGFAFLLLIISLNRNHKFISPILILLSLFIDERSIFPGTMILLYHSHASITKPIIQTLFVMSTYVIIRVLLTKFYGLNDIFYRSHDLIIFGHINNLNFPLFTIATINCFKNIWIFPIMAFQIFFQKTRSFLALSRLLLIVGIFVGVFVAASSVADFTRSFSYGFPIFLFSLKYVHDNQKNGVINHWNIPISKLIILVILFNLLTETHFFHSGTTLNNTTDIFSKTGAYLFK